MLLMIKIFGLLHTSLFTIFKSLVADSGKFVKESTLIVRHQTKKFDFLSGMPHLQTPAKPPVTSDLFLWLQEARWMLRGGGEPIYLENTVSR